MKILVCVKQVPDTESRFTISQETNWYNEEDLIYVLNEYDSYASEEAVRLKEKSENSELTVLTIGPQRSREVLVKVMGMGADKGVHILDPQEWKRDPFQKASIIARFCEDKKYDIIFFGLQSPDRGSGQVGPMVASILGLPCITNIVRFEFREYYVIAERELERSVRARVKAKPPLIVTCQSGLNQPRYVSLMNRRRAQKKEITTLNVEELLDVEPLTKTERLYSPEKRTKGIVLEGNIHKTAEKLADILREQVK